MVRLYDSMLNTLKELTEVASQLGGAAGEYLLDECSAKVNCLVSGSQTNILPDIIGAPDERTLGGKNKGLQGRFSVSCYVEQV